MRTRLTIRRWDLVLLFGGIAVLAALLRFAFLDARTIHIDEGVSILYGQQILGGTWLYNPFNAHGPVFFMFAAQVVRFFGTNVVAGRAAMGIVNLLWIGALLWLYWPLLRNPGRLLLAAGLGLSSGLIFYSRYFIHEQLFMLITVGALAAAEMWVQRRRSWAPATFIVLCALLYSTKETAVFTVGAWAAAVALLFLEPGREKAIAELDWQNVLFGVALGASLILLLFTQLFTDSTAVAHLFQGPLHWFDRAQAYHVRPFPYFLQLLVVHEYPLLLGALLLGWRLVVHRAWTPRLTFFALWTIFITLAYSWVPYKTPWCIPNLILPLGLFVAFAFDTLWPHVPEQWKQAWLLSVILLLGAGTATAWADSIQHPDRVQPLDYAYLQSDKSFGRFLQTIQDISNLSQGPHPLPIQFIGEPDELLHVVTEPYATHEASEPLQPGLPLYINYMHDDMDTLQKIEDASGKTYIRSTYRYLRDWGTLVDLFVEQDLWNRYLTDVAHEDVQEGEHPVYDYSN